MAVTIEQLLSEVAALGQKRDELSAAHDATVAAHVNVVNVTTVEQGNIDAAVAHFDIATTEAKQEATVAEGAESDASSAEEDAFNQLVADITAFKNNG